ncbi:MAG: family 78 glycoside hydrolase catalytic domain, partial [Clostridia bacterium]|nr:family 78 glycoside hydrolase catalytic domain [Clostridia bacterium]
MISNLKCNGEVAPISVDRRACFTWTCGFKQDHFSVKILKEGKEVFKDCVDSNLCRYELEMDLDELSTYRAVFECFSGNASRSESINFRTALKNGFPQKAKWIGCGSIKKEDQDFNGNPATYLWKNFEVKKIEPTYLHIAGLGLFVVYINGKKVSDDVLSNPFTNYEKSVLYSNYEVSSYLTVGKNEVVIILGDGWYNQTATDEWDFYKADWRDNCKAIVFMEGAVELFSDEGFSCSRSGAITASSIRLGERVDFTKDFRKDALSARAMNAPLGHLKSMQESPIRPIEYITPKSVKNHGDCYIYDFCCSITGFVRLKANINGHVKIRYGDRLDENGRIDNSSNGQYVYGGNYQTDFLFGDGKEYEYSPSFTYHAFRYVEIEGLERLEGDQLLAVFVRTSFEKVGDFFCDDDRLNKLFDLSIRSMECNYTGFPTDCPHREKNGWTGDMQLSAKSFIQNFDCEEALLKWLEDIREAQAENGMIPCIVPTSSWGYNWGNGPAWDYALFNVAYELYRIRGYTSAIKEIYNICKKYLDFILSKEVNGLYEMGLGDWNYPKRIEFDVCPTRLTSSCYVYAMCGIFSEFSRILNKPEEQSVYYSKALDIKTKIVNEFINCNSIKGATANAALLYFKILEGKKADEVFDTLVQIIENSGYKSIFGILGAK